MGITFYGLLLVGVKCALAKAELTRVEYLRHHIVVVLMLSVFVYCIKEFNTGLWILINIRFITEKQEV